MSRMGQEHKRWWRNSDDYFVSSSVEGFTFSFYTAALKRKYKRNELLHSDLGMLPHCPKEWNRLMHTVPKRRLTKKIMKRLTKDPELADGICLPTGNRRPHLYYW